MAEPTHSAPAPSAGSPASGPRVRRPTMVSSSGNATAHVRTGGLVQLARQGLEDIVAIRHDLHAHPELGFEEVRTSAMVASKLAEWGITEVAQLGGTGLVATIRG